MGKLILQAVLISFLGISLNWAADVVPPEIRELAEIYDRSVAQGFTPRARIKTSIPILLADSKPFLGVIFPRFNRQCDKVIFALNNSMGMLPWGPCEGDTQVVLGLSA